MPLCNKRKQAGRKEDGLTHLKDEELLLNQESLRWGLLEDRGKRTLPLGIMKTGVVTKYK